MFWICKYSINFQFPNRLRLKIALYLARLHNQRALVSVKVAYAEEAKSIWLEDLIELIENCASCPVYPLLKREDEKFVTEKAWNNPKFVEDVLRDAVVSLRKLPDVIEFDVDCEAFESIHNHSAWAYQREVKEVL